MKHSRWIVVALVGGLFAWMFAGLAADRALAVRDAAHFYYPLFEYIQDQWRAGRLPEWNPHENAGAPLAADPAASVFYPGKLVFFLPIDHARAMNLYVAGHLLLAAFGAYRLARHFHASVEAAGACAVSYAFSGSVLFQYTNVIYLVGAAWLPAALWAADHMLRRRGLAAALLLGVVLAMTTLGGDPQMAYHAGLLAALDALILWQCRRRLSRFTRRGLSRFSHSENGTIPLSPDSKPVMPSEAKHLANPNPDEILRRAQDDGGLAHDNRRCLFHRPRHPAPLLLALAAATALVLSAIQVFPSAVFARLSNRADATAPRSVWEIPSAFHLDDPAKRIADGLLCRRLDGESHARHAYHFSVGPWRWAEYVWPNFSGRQFPIHRRWIAAVPAEGRVWTPSLYMGVVPLLLALSALRPRRGRPAVAWMSWTAVLAVLAALGWYGLGWLAAECRAACGITADGGTLGYPVGGLYWLMTVLLPGYVYFRYPAKLLVVAALALGVLAARGWDAAFRHDSPRPRRAFAALGGISLVGAAAAFATRPWWPGWFAAAEPDVLFGPLDASGAAADLSFGLLQTAVVCGLAWWLLSLRWASGCAPALLDEPAVAPGAPANRRRWIPAAMLALVCVDLAVANGWMVVAAPAELWRAPSRLVQAIRADRARRGETGPVRVWRHPTWLPTSWKAAGSPDRLAESVAWDRDTLRPKYNLPERIGGVEVYGSMMPAAYRRFLAEHSPDEIMAATGAEYAILPPGETLPGGRPVSEEAKDVSLWYRDATHDPRAAAALPNNSVLRARLSTALACGATLSGLGWLGLVGFALTRRRWR